MHYTSLLLNNFRSYPDYTVELSPGVNIVVGPNASGKTNLLEAILFVSSGSSYRARDRDLITHNAEWAKVVATGEDQYRRSIVIRKQSTDKTNKEIVVDDKKYVRMSQQNVVPVTLFEPEHMRMVHGAPERRREYVDGILAQTIPIYKRHIRNYKRTLAQRNKLLKHLSHHSATPPKDQLFVWDLKLSEYGGYIADQRIQLIVQINQSVGEIYSSLSGKVSTLMLDYMTNTSTNDYTSSMLSQLQQSHARDAATGFTSVGPHRDDIGFILNGQSAVLSASRGESRTIVLACKMLELKMLESSHRRPPVLLLDDVFSELDSARRRHLTEYLERYQTVITTTDADAILRHFMGEYRVIPTVVTAT